MLKARIFNTLDFGYQKIIVEQPQKDENGNNILKKGKPVADTALRDSENVSFNEDINDYFEREVKPYAPEAWIDANKTKIGYEIPMTRYFYKYQEPEKTSDIIKRLNLIETEISNSLKRLFPKGE